MTSSKDPTQGVRQQQVKHHNLSQSDQSHLRGLQNTNHSIVTPAAQHTVIPLLLIVLLLTPGRVGHPGSVSQLNIKYLQTFQ